MTIIWVVVGGLWLLVIYHVLIQGRPKRPAGDYKSRFSPKIHITEKDSWMELLIHIKDIEELMQFKREFWIGKPVEHKGVHYRIVDIKEEKKDEERSLMKVSLEIKEKARDKTYTNGEE